MGFRIAVSGLRAAGADLDVTGNNIANSNTVGFKKSRAEFADVYAVSNLGASSDAIGQGTQLAAVSQQFTQGNVSFTDNSLDLAVSGQGFFVLEDAGSRVYSRDGTMGIDKDGFVVNSSGHNLVGYQALNGTVSGALAPIQVARTIQNPHASSRVQLSVNLDSSQTSPTIAFDPTDTTSFNNSTSVTVFDSLGAEHVATVYFRKTGTNAWDTHLRVDGDNSQTTTTQAITFNSSGQLTTAMPANYGTYTPTNGSAPIPLDIDLTDTVQLGPPFGVLGVDQDGFTSGRLVGLDIDDGGIMLARYTNGQSEPQGQIALANFGNAQGLTPIGDTDWVETSASGNPLVGPPGSASLGLIQSGALEESNVDLAEELVDMIIAQRAFQANAQMIQTEDEVTQTIINIG